MNVQKWIESQKERIKAKSNIQGPHSCLICSCGGQSQRYPTMSVFLGNQAENLFYATDLHICYIQKVLIYQRGWKFLTFAMKNNV